MIDLSRTRAGFLAGIEAPDPPGDPATDLTDPRVATADVHVQLRGHTRADLFPLLKLALAERFAAVPRLELIRDLLLPLRHALGNACKHGNGADPSKTVTVEIVLTGKGALIAVTDEGRGFDAASILRRFLEQQPYFLDQGAGFRNLQQARSTASYENGGRTFLLCFRSPEAPEPASGPGAAPAADPRILDPAWIVSCLSADAPEFRDGRARLESCRVYAAGGADGGRSENRYLLRVAAAIDGGPARTRILTGRLHTTERAAEADFAAATRLREAQISRTVLIPRPVAQSAEQPRLVFYEFDPWLSLWEYLSHQASLPTLEHCGARIGRALARLHRSPVLLPARDAEPDGGDTGFGWDGIHYGADGRLYLYPFEWCSRSDPRRELGGYAADLIRFTLTYHDAAAYRRCRDALLEGYNSRAEHPLGEDDLRLSRAGCDT